MVNIQALIEDAKCFETVRSMRWPDGVHCPECGSAEVTKDGRDDSQAERQRCKCHGCGRRSDDLSGPSSPATTSRYASGSCAYNSWA